MVDAGAPMTAGQIFLRLLRDSLAWRGRLAVALVALIVASASQLALTWTVKRWADRMVDSYGPETLRDIALGGAVLVASLIVSLFVSRYLLNSVNQRLLEALRGRIHDKLLGGRVAAVRGYRAGELLSRVFADTSQLSGFVRDVFQRMVGETLVMVGAFAMLFYLEWRLAIVGLITVPLVGALMVGIGRVIRRRATRAQEAVGALSATLTEQLRGLTTIKSYRGEDVELRRFARQNTLYRRNVLRTEWWSLVLVCLVWLVGGLLMMSLVWFGTRAMMRGSITSGGLVAFCLYAAQIVEPLRRLSDVHGFMQRGIAAAARVYGLIDATPQEVEGGLEPAPPLRGELCLESVDFAYGPDTEVLRELSFRVAPGENLAIVAASGGGKSTLASLLVRHADPGGGDMFLDGQNLRRLSLASLRGSVCVVEQDAFVFRASLRYNVAYGLKGVSDAAVDHALRRAGLGEWVDSLGGIHAEIEESGTNMSGGEKQRIALARAIVRDPAVLVLDEATSALDGDVEAKIFADLQDWFAQRTTIVMAHRLSTIVRFPRIIVIDGGRLVGDGNVVDLRRDCAEFAELFGDQLASLEILPRRTPKRPDAVPESLRRVSSGDG